MSFGLFFNLYIKWNRSKVQVKKQHKMGAAGPLLNSESFVSTFSTRQNQIRRTQKAIGSLISRILSCGFLRGSAMVKKRFHIRRGSMVTLALLMAVLFMVTVLVLMILDLGIVYLHIPSDDSTIVSLRRKVFESGIELGERGEQWVEVLSSSEPRAFLYHNFLSKEECEYMIALAKPRMRKSTVIDSETGRSKDSRVRTSTGMFLMRGQDKIVGGIEKRIAEFTFIPIEHGESIQVLNYQVGQKYEPHYDYFLDEFNVKHGGQRIATVLMYLSDVEEGGETVFPTARGNISDVPWWNELSECGRGGLAVKPKMGDALLFWSMNPDATVDPSSMHGSCPVIKGSKWSATKWMRVHEY